MTTVSDTMDPTSLPASNATTDAEGALRPKGPRTRPPLPPEFKELCNLCKAGKLFAVQKWFKEHKYSEPANINSRQWPMGIAIDMGFNSLVEVLLQNGVPADGSALDAALWRRHEEFVRLLLHYGADVRSVPFADVVDTGSPNLIRLFIEGGADMFTGFPIAKGLIQTTRPLLGIYKSYIEKYPQLQFQADMALRHFCEEGSLRGVSLLMWLGANPRAKVPRDEEECEDFWTTPLEAAAFDGKLEIIKRLKPDPVRDNLNHLLSQAAWRLNPDLVQYFTNLGADINSNDEEGRALHGKVISDLSWRLEPNAWGSGGMTRADAIKFTHHWFSLGAKWSPGREDYRDFRRCFSLMSAIEGYEFIKLLRVREVIPGDALGEVLDTPKLRQHLKDRRAAIASYVPQLVKWLKDGRAVRR